MKQAKDFSLRTHYNIPIADRFYWVGTDLRDRVEETFQEKGLPDDLVQRLARGDFFIDPSDTRLLEGYEPYKQAVGARQERNVNLPLARAANEAQVMREQTEKQQERVASEQQKQVTTMGRKAAVLEAARRARSRIAQQNVSALSQARGGSLNFTSGRRPTGFQGRGGFASVSDAVLG